MTITVQGTPVATSQNYGLSSHNGQSTQASTHQNWTRGEKQESKCRDPIFAALGWINVIAILVVCAIFGPDAFSETTNQNFEEFEGYLVAVVITGLFSVVLSGLMLLVMMRIPTLLVKASLIFVVILSGIWAAAAIFTGNIFVGAFGILFFVLSICYARAVWSRIPFASANLLTACTAVRDNCGVTILSYFFVLLAFVWSIIWAIALLGVWEKTYTCTDAGCTDPNYFFLFLLFLSYFFAHQILQNTIHVIVAGVVGTWWITPEEGKGCCSVGVRGSFWRAVTTSFGSICFGSLIVAIIQALKQLAAQARAEGDAGFLACIAECILGCLESIVEYFNKWAFIYVGLYGYGYIDAGKNVITLFKNRGWEAIIADDLVGNVLFMVSLVVGAISGVIGIIIEQSSGFFENSGSNASLVAFILGLVVGLVLCSIFMSSIGSAVNAVVVLFAEAPAEFQQHYPELSTKMNEAWRSAYPDYM
eukprot:CAMPEP_0202445168 /NCGR_PEP_ID=MMETSP1360-20130828/4044_1 /ASSEMBLY_ACC=CAM_ASM_000848 /TAXON_ID=515479 /ORGANISM="Licmophora paradoxa, Strain CCMP2313" /LENGTH=475 /DNA_ID=CAMNT_0049061345 /DNA_START=49 /DNA_END=1476 /DNA_ORIENTATION=+